MNQKLLVRKLDPRASLPQRGTPEAAGLDIQACLPEGTTITIPPVTECGVKGNHWAVIPTGLSMRCPDGTYARVAPRSGRALEGAIDVLAGVVDIDYTGHVGVVLINLGTEPLTISHGERVAQIVLQLISMADAEEVDELPETGRGAAGYGSTGK